MTSEFPLSLSTAVAPATRFLVDGEEYELLGTDHLSPDDEAAVMAMFARHNILSRDLSFEKNVVKGKIIAERQRKSRLDIICKLTTLPDSVAHQLPLSQQVKLLEAIQVEVEVTDDEDEEAESPAEVAASAEEA